MDSNSYAIINVCSDGSTGKIATVRLDASQEVDPIVTITAIKTTKHFNILITITLP